MRCGCAFRLGMLTPLPDSLPCLFPLHPSTVAHAKAAGLSTSEVPDVSGDVVFLRSFTDSRRLSLLRRAQAVVYTPSNEHFGIVPVEAMYGGRPVIACKSGGPCETVVDGLTGYLCVDEKVRQMQGSVVVSSPSLASLAYPHPPTPLSNRAPHILWTGLCTCVPQRVLIHN